MARSSRPRVPGSTSAGGARNGTDGTPARRGTTRPATGGRAPSAARVADLVAQLDTIERGGGDGIVVFGRGITLPVTSLDRAVWPREGITKGALMRYYVRVAPALLPLLADRPLVLERHPRGITGPSFHKHDPGDSAPPSVRVADVAMEDGTPAARLVGGDLPTLLHSVQLGAIAVNPWHARLDDLEHPDYLALDLDPMPRVPASRVIRLAGLLSARLDALGLRHALKTSGSRGLHLVVPLPPGTSWDAAASLAESIARDAAASHPDLATIERALADRPRGTIYVDHLQNARGKTLAAPWSARARPGAPVSTPVSRAELERGEADPRGWTLETVPAGLAARRRLWTAPLRAGNDAAVLRGARRALRAPQERGGRGS